MSLRRQWPHRLEVSGTVRNEEILCHYVMSTILKRSLSLTEPLTFRFSADGSPLDTRTFVSLYSLYFRRLPLLLKVRRMTSDKVKMSDQWGDTVPVTDPPCPTEDWLSTVHSEENLRNRGPGLVLCSRLRLRIEEAVTSSMVTSTAVPVPSKRQTLRPGRTRP